MEKYKKDAGAIAISDMRDEMGCYCNRTRGTVDIAGRCETCVEDRSWDEMVRYPRIPQGAES